MTDAGSSITLHVAHDRNTNDVYAFQFNPSATITDLKLFVEPFIGVPTEYQRLSYQGRLICTDPDATLQQVGLVHQSSIQVAGESPWEEKVRKLESIQNDAAMVRAETVELETAFAGTRTQEVPDAREQERLDKHWKMLNEKCIKLQLALDSVSVGGPGITDQIQADLRQQRKQHILYVQETESMLDSIKNRGPGQPAA